MVTTMVERSGELGRVSNDGQPFRDLLAAAIEKLRTGVLEEAHKALIRLIRSHRNDAEVIFNLGIARKRLGYDVSAEALFRQAFERGYRFPVDAQATPLPDRPGFLHWVDPSSDIELVLRQRPRRNVLIFVGCENPVASPEVTPEDDTSSAVHDTDAPDLPEE